MLRFSSLVQRLLHFAPRNCPYQQDQAELPNSTKKLALILKELHHIEQALNAQRKQQWRNGKDIGKVLRTSVCYICYNFTNL